MDSWNEDWHMTPDSSAGSADPLRELYRDEYVTRYWEKEKGFHRRRIERLIPFFELDKKDVVADFACGLGLLLDTIHGRVAEYHGVDFSSEFIAEASERAERLGQAEASFYSEDIRDFCRRHRGVFDKTFALDFSEHVYDRELLEIAGEIRSSLKPGGRLFLHTPNGDFLLEILKNRGIMRQFPEHVAVRGPSENVELMQQAGFSKVEIRYLAHYLPPVSWLHVASGVPFAGKYLKARLLLECTA